MGLSVYEYFFFFLWVFFILHLLCLENKDLFLINKTFQFFVLCIIYLNIYFLNLFIVFSCNGGINLFDFTFYTLLSCLYLLLYGLIYFIYQLGPIYIWVFFYFIGLIRVFSWLGTSLLFFMYLTCYLVLGMYLLDKVFKDSTGVILPPSKPPTLIDHSVSRFKKFCDLWVYDNAILKDHYKVEFVSILCIRYTLMLEAFIFFICRGMDYNTLPGTNNYASAIFLLNFIFFLTIMYVNGWITFFCNPNTEGLWENISKFFTPKSTRVIAGGLVAAAGASGYVVEQSTKVDGPILPGCFPAQMLYLNRSAPMGWQRKYYYEFYEIMNIIPPHVPGKIWEIDYYITKRTVHAYQDTLAGTGSRDLAEEAAHKEYNLASWEMDCHYFPSRQMEKPIGVDLPRIQGVIDVPVRKPQVYPTLSEQQFVGSSNKQDQPLGLSKIFDKPVGVFNFIDGLVKEPKK